MSNRRRRDAIKSATRRYRKQNLDYKKVLAEVGQWFLIILVAGIFGYSVIQFVGQTITVVGQSMNTVLENGDEVWVNKLTYTLSSPKRYDIVAFKLRKNDEYYSVKRVIGLPGETVKIQDGKIYINDVQLLDVPNGTYIMTSGIAAEGVTLDKNEYFLLGDNYSNSEDSRFANVGNVLKNEILGKVSYRISPKENKGKVE